MHLLIVRIYISGLKLRVGSWILKEKFYVRKAFLFIGFIPSNKKLYKFLKNSGYKLIFKPVVKNKLGKPKGNVDAELVLHAMIEFPNYDRAIIVSGDGDFYCLAKYLMENNKLLKIVTPSKRYSSLLRKLSLYIVQVTQFREKVIRQ